MNLITSTTEFELLKTQLGKKSNIPLIFWRITFFKQWINFKAMIFRKLSKKK